MRARLVFALLLVSVANRVDAHVISDPRVLVVVPTGALLEIRVNEMSQPGEESISLRRRFDGDRDGKLDDSEKSDLASFLVLRATKNLKVWQDGKPLAFSEKTRAIRGTEKGIDTSDSVSIDVVLVAKPVARSKHVSIEIGDWRPDGHAVRVAVLGEGAQLVKSSLGEIDRQRGVVTGISLDTGVTERLEYELP